MPVASQAPVERQLLSLADVSLVTGIPIRTLRQLELDGRIPSAIRVARRLRWRRADIEAWIDAGCPSCSQTEGRANAK